MLLRKTRHVRAVTSIRTTVIHRVQPSVLFQDQSESIIERLAVVQFSSLQHLFTKRRPANAWVIEVLIPQSEIFNCRVQTRSTRSVKVGDAEAESFTLGWLVSIGA
jgi:hypothetical protein